MKIKGIKYLVILTLSGKAKLSMASCKQYFSNNLLYRRLEDDPRSTPGHSKVFDQIRAIMKLVIVVSTVGLTKKLLKCYVDVQKHLEQLLKYPNQS